MTGIFYANDPGVQSHVPFLDPPTPKREVPDVVDPKSMITLKFDKDGEVIEFSIHRDVAFHRCAAIKTAIEASGSTTYLLDGTTPEAARLLFQWLYFEEIDVSQLRINPANRLNESFEGDCALIELWVLAEKLKLPALQNLAIKAIDSSFGNYGELNYPCVMKAYELTTAGSQLRKFFIAWCIETGLDELNMVDMSKEILMDVVVESVKNLDLIKLDPTHPMEKIFGRDASEFYVPVAEA